MALAPGTSLGHYQVSALIGEGGMGQVWQATDTQLNRQVALKILPDAFADDPDRLARFQREAQILASLNHPNNRGELLMTWGETGYAPGQFRALHAIALHPDGRVFVGDRSNSRLQIFDQEGNHTATWTQFGRPSGIAFDDQGRIYVADSESDNVQNPGYEMGIRIGEVETGWVKEFIRFPRANPHILPGNGAEFVAVDSEGNLYGGEPVPNPHLNARTLRKYVRVRP